MIFRIGRWIYGIAHNFLTGYLQLSYVRAMLSLVSFVIIFYLLYKVNVFSRINSLIYTSYNVLLLNIVWFGRQILSEERPVSFNSLFSTYIQMKTENIFWVVLNIFINIVLFIPEGFLLRALRIKRKALRLLITISFCLVIESVQLVFNIGTFEICDLIDNALGILVGYCVSKYISSEKKYERINYR